MPMMPFCAAGDAAQLDRAVLDDEAEGDRDHREIGPRTRSAGCASEHADEAASARPSGQRSQNGSPLASSSTPTA